MVGDVLRCRVDAGPKGQRGRLTIDARSENNDGIHRQGKKVRLPLVDDNRFKTAKHQKSHCNPSPEASFAELAKPAFLRPAA